MMDKINDPINYLMEKGWTPDEIEKRMQETGAKDYTELAQAVELGESDRFPYIQQRKNKNGEVIGEYVSPPLLADHIRKREKYLFVNNGAFSGETRFWYSGGCYRLVNDNKIRSIIKGYIERYNIELVKMKDVDEVFRQLITDDVYYDANDINADENIINFRNGILHLDTMELTKHSPDYLCTRQIPVDWKEDAECPDFMSYMQFFCNGEKGHTKAGDQMYTFLLEFMGACISNVKGYRFKKTLFLYGDGDTGKSQLKTLTEFMLGSENCNPIDLEQLEARFGTSSIYNKRLVGSSDMKYATVKELSTLKQVTGGDTITAEYKGQNAFNFRYDGMTWFCCNKLPKFGGDNGQWVYDRIIPLESKYVVPEEKRDRTLQDKLQAEASGIAVLAITHLKDAIKRGYKFAEPDESAEIRKKYKKSNNTLDLWFSECCVDVHNAQEPDDIKTVAEFVTNKSARFPSCNQMYLHYAEYCKRYEKGYCLSKQSFKEEIEERYGERCIERRMYCRVYKGFCLNANEMSDWKVQNQYS